MDLNKLNIQGTAFLLSNGQLSNKDAKTTHGLIRYSERFVIKAVIDSTWAGHDAGEVLDGIHRNIPVCSDLENAIEKSGKPDYCIIGVATVGGVLPDSLLEEVKTALTKGIAIVNGLHSQLGDQPEIIDLVEEYGAKVFDIRQPKTFSNLKFWSEEIFEVKCPIIAIMGMDCALGKRTSAILLKQACEKAGLRAEMIYTGQTGWMQGARYGFILDSTINDFVAGELSHAIITAYHQENPDLIFIEGQSSLRNPSGPCGAEFLISGNAKKVILIHEPIRKYFDNDPKWGEIPSVESEVNLIKCYGSETIALMLNTTGLTEEEAYSIKQSYSENLGIPVILPLEEGVNSLINILMNIKK